jgi:hypothetical protein
MATPMFTVKHKASRLRLMYDLFILAYNYCCRTQDKTMNRTRSQLGRGGYVSAEGAALT